MTNTPPGTQGTDPEPGEPTGPRVTREEARELGRIRRSLTDRKVAGVAGGMARHFDVDPLLVRVAFVLLAIFGGGGILAYVAGWLLIPEEGSDDARIRTDERTRTVLLTVIGAICALTLVGDAFGGWEFPWPLAIIGLVLALVMAAKGGTKPHPGPLPQHGWVPPGTPGTSYVGYQPAPPYRPMPPQRRGPILFWFTMALAALATAVVGTVDLAGADVPLAAYPATVLVTCGVMLLVGACYGRAGGLIFVGLVAAVATAAATVVEDVSAGEVLATPAQAAALDDSYELGVGRIRVDLTEVEDLEALDGRTLDLGVQIGQVEVIVPEEGIDVAVDADIDGGGHALIFDEERDGSLSATHDGGSGADVPQLTINADLEFGEVRVVTEEAAR